MASEHKETIRMVKIQSYDGVVVEVPEAAAIQSVVIKFIIEDVGVAHPIPTPNVAGDVLTKVFEFCTKHAEFDAAAAATAATAAAGKSGPDDEQAAAAAAAKEEMESWDRQFVNVCMDTLYDLLTAANYLEIKGLMDLCCDKVASMISKRWVEEIRTTFNIANDFTPEEEEAVRRQYSWSYPRSD